ncbi:MAG: dTDP-4-dehydrorhamnose 3,5-epimerase family protein [Deltaproteobacteria bacterium]|nr:dTDP-4-dehydrorhamnose 3,5-epimerase family protein [Deltaproteobacteria bacterium]
MKRIQGVVTKALRVIPDERGRLMEILRSDDAMFRKFGQAYLSTTYPGVVKAWHYHKLQDDCFCCVAGMIKLVIFDNRSESPTYRQIDELFIGEHNLQLVVVPRLCYHGWKSIGERESLVFNIPTEVYNYAQPDEYRLDPHRNDVIAYDWSRKDG